MKPRSKLVIPLIIMLIVSVGFAISAVVPKLIAEESLANESSDTINQNYESEVGNSNPQVTSGIHFSSYEEQEKYINELMKNFSETSVVEQIEIPIVQKQDNEAVVPRNTPKYKNQFIAISFDGSYSQPRWKSLLKFSNEQELLGTNIHFTFFVSGVYLLSNSQKYSYTPPRLQQGKSNIGFGGSAKEINERFAIIKETSADGHEIASHANGHYGGSLWTYDEWMSEFNQFTTFISPITIPPVKGFRAPLLETNRSMYEALKNIGFTYDASGVADMNTAPRKDGFGIWHFPLVFLKLGNKNTLSMDYNHYIAQTQGQNILKKETLEWQHAYDEVYNSYISYFEHNYNSHRIPLNIGHHFSLWNDGVYYEALLDFAETVCGKPDVICGTYSELVHLLEANNLWFR